VVVAVNLAVATLPEVGSEPVQPPVAVQEVALVDDQVRVVLLPLATEVAAAVKVTVGADVPPTGAATVVDCEATATLTDFEVEPPLPVQDKL